MNRYEQRIHELRGEFVGALQGKLPVHLSESKLQEVEEELGFTLPGDYREFITDYGNFGLFNGPTFLLESGDEAGFEVFYGVIDNENDDFQDIVSRYRSFCSMGYWPPELLPIAADAGSNNVALCVEGEDRGVVVMVYNDMWGRDEENIIFVADSFDEFMQSIYLSRGDEE